MNAYEQIKEALVVIRDAATCGGSDFGNPAIRGLLDQMDMIRATAQSALATPPRNFDRFADEAEAEKAFIDWYNTVYGLWGDKWCEVSSCELKHNVNDILQEYIKWLFDTAEEKGDGK